jgi:hypothetical protein
MMHRGPGLLFFLFAAAATFAHASVALFMEEPYGEFGAVNPTGHAAVYFNHICADSPTSLRPCHDGEYGVVISRYHKIDGYDWLAIPLVPYLYAVDSPNDVPQTVDQSAGNDAQSASRPASFPGSALASVSSVEQRFVILDTKAKVRAESTRVSPYKADAYRHLPVPAFGA